MSIAPYIMFSGNCAEAMRHYQQVLGGELQVMTNGEAPEGGMPGADPNLVMHAGLDVEGQLLMASDDPTGDGGPKVGILIAYTAPDPDAAARALDGLAEGGTITMPIEATFWSPAFGMCTDRFGVQWMVDCNVAEGTPAP